MDIFKVKASILLIQATFQALGLLINNQKSTFIPVEGIEFYRRSARFYPGQGLLPRRPLSDDGAYIAQHVRLHLTSLQYYMASVYLPNHHHSDTVLTVPTPVLDWRRDPRLVGSGVPFIRHQHSISLVSDALVLAFDQSVIKVWVNLYSSPSQEGRQYCHAFHKDPC